MNDTVEAVVQTADEGDMENLDKKQKCLCVCVCVCAPPVQGSFLSMKFSLLSKFRRVYKPAVDGEYFGMREMKEFNKNICTLHRKF